MSGNREEEEWNNESGCNCVGPQLLLELNNFSKIDRQREIALVGSELVERAFRQKQQPS